MSPCYSINRWLEEGGSTPVLVGSPEEPPMVPQESANHIAQVEANGEVDTSSGAESDEESPTNASSDMEKTGGKDGVDELLRDSKGSSSSDQTKHDSPTGTETDENPNGTLR
ncbi:hypothetical protein MMC18_007033 [Xylographa bjoerkii]|nr:hypothetical protein [Xylographa bjoerkii]